MRMFGDYENEFSNLNKCLIEAILFISPLHRQFWLGAVMCRFSSQILIKMDYKEEAQKLVNYSLNLLSIQCNTDGEVMKRSQCLLKARMIARSHISFAINQGGFAPHLYDYWKKVEEEIDKCF